MIPPTFSKPKPAWYEKRQANCRTTTRLRLVEGVKEQSSYMAPVNDKFQTMKPGSYWIDCKQDKEDLKQWLAAQGLEGGQS